MALFLDLIKKHEDKANALYGVFSSGYSTVMFTQQILIKSIGMSLSAIYSGVIFGLIAFNFLLDKYVFDFIETYIRSHYKKDFKLSLDDRETIKFLILLIIATTCIFAFSIYIIPIVLLLFQSGYFLNFYLQKGYLSDTLEKIFFTRDQNNKNRLFSGFIDFEEAGQAYQLSNNHIRLLQAGAAVSLVFSLTMVALAAKWLVPFIGSVAFLGSLLSPLGFIFGAAFVGYGLILYFFILRSWAKLLQLDAKNKDKGGLFSTAVIVDFLWQTFCHKPSLIIQDLTQILSQCLESFFYAVVKHPDKSRLQALREGFKALALLGWKFLLLIWEAVKITIKITISLLSFIGMYYTHDQGGKMIADVVQNKNTGTAMTFISAAAQTPQMAMSTSYILNSENNNESELNQWSLARIRFYLFANILRTGLIFNGGEVPERYDTRTSATAAGTMAASGVILNHYVPENFSKINTATKAPLLSDYQRPTETHPQAFNQHEPPQVNKTAS